MNCSDLKPVTLGPCSDTNINLWDYVRALIAAKKSIPLNPTGCHYEPGYASNGCMVEVSTVPALVGDTHGPEKALALAGVPAESALQISKLLNAFAKSTGADAYDLAEALVNAKGANLLKFSRTQFKQIQVYQRVRARYHG